MYVSRYLVSGRLRSGSKITVPGYAIIEIKSMEGSPSICKSFPFLDIEGSPELSALVKMLM